MSAARYSEYKESGVDWFGIIPEYWEVMRNKNLFAEIDVRNENDDAELLTVSHLTGVTKRSEKNVNMFLAETLKGYKCCKDGDLVINTMWAWMGALGISVVDGVVSPSYNVYRPRDITKLHSKYFDYLCRIPDHVRVIRANSTGVWESRLRLYPNTFLSMKTCLPPYTEQRVIADFLDHESAKIDALVEKQEKLIALLKEKRQAVISHAVTKGIDPSVPMKDSGIEWLGEVPEHWEVTKLKDVTSKIGSGKTPRGGSEVYTDSGVIFIRSQNVHFDGLRLDEVVFIDEATDEEMIATQVQHQDVLLNITGASIGRCCVVEADCPKANVNQHVCILRPIVSKMIPHFLSNVISSLSIQTQIAIVNQGTSREGLNFQQAGSLVFAYPKDLQEQRKIVNFLGEQFDRIDTLMFESQRAVTLLKERRSALISAAVTGKIDVRGLVAEEVGV